MATPPERPPIQWAQDDFFPSYIIRFRLMNAYDDIRLWFDELLIAICYNQLHVLQQFSHLMNTWINLEDEDKREEMSTLLNSTGRWEAIEAFNHLMFYDPRLMIQFTEIQERQQEKAFAYLRELPFTWDCRWDCPWDRRRRILTLDVEKRAVSSNEYHYVLYAFYVFQIPRFHPLIFVPFDTEILNYFNDIHREQFNNQDYDLDYNAAKQSKSTTDFRVYRSKMLAKINFYKYIREFVVDHVAYKPNAIFEDWRELHNLAYSRVVTHFPTARYGDLSGEFLPNRRGETPMQTFLKQLCTALKPYCTPSLLSFKRYLMHMHSLARNVLFTGKANAYYTR